MYKPYPGGSKLEIGWEDQTYTIYLPPVGKVFDKMTGKIIRTEIMFEDRDPLDRRVPQGRRKPTLPDEYKEWVKQEKTRDDGWQHPLAKQFRDDQWFKRINGCWVSIYKPSEKKAVPVYLTGLHWFYIFYWPADFGMPDFHECDLEVMYMLEATDVNPYTNGLTLAGPRRWGKTAILGCWSFEMPSRTKNAYGGIQGQTRLDAGNVFQRNLVYPFRNIVDFFRPEFDYTTSQSASIEFLRPFARGKSGKDSLEEEDTSLHSIIDFRDAQLYSYDGYKLHRYGVEEGGKTTEVDIYKRTMVCKPCTEVQGEIIGQIFAPTTCEEIEGKGADRFHDMFIDSMPSRIEGFVNKTITGLFAYFMQADKAYQFDDYGWSRQEDSRREIMAHRELLKNKPDELAAYVRKYPLTLDEAFLAGKGICVFNEYLLNKRYAELDKLPDHELNYVQGNLEWDNGKDSDVIFVRDDINGKFYFAWLPDPNVANRVTQDSYGQWRPLNDSRFAIATDPISHTKTTDPRASKAAAHGFRKYDIHADHGKAEEDWESHNYIFEYLYRPQEIEEYFEDMIKAGRFLGCQILHESNKNNIAQHFRARGYDHLIMYRPRETWTTMTGAQDAPGIPASRETIDMYVTKLKTFINRHGHRFPFKRTIAQLLRFNPQKTTEHDLAVSAGWTLMALEKEVESMMPVDLEPAQWFEQYNVSGQESETIHGIN